MSFDWLIHTRQGFITRLVAGLMFFITLAIYDLRKNGRHARRWREYAFLLFCTGVAIVYGVINDQVTSRISWEYFYYGKSLEEVLGPQTPPDRMALSVQVVKIGIMATWSVGLILGIALLVANNPRKNSRPPLRYVALMRLLPTIVLLTVALAVAGGFLGWGGFLNWISADFAQMWQVGYFRPRHFMAAWGAHLGGYIGGLVGGIYACRQVIVLRRALPAASTQ